MSCLEKNMLRRNISRLEKIEDRLRPGSTFLIAYQHRDLWRVDGQVMTGKELSALAKDDNNKILRLRIHGY